MAIPAALRREAASFIASAISAADPKVAVLKHLAWEAPKALRIGTAAVDLAHCTGLLVFALGKAGVPMAAAAIRALHSNATITCPPIRGLVVTKRGHASDAHDVDTVVCCGVDIIEAGHPQPDEASASAGNQLLALASTASASDVVLVLLSGGASALSLTPRAGLTLLDLQATNAALLGCGAAIEDVNAVRKHLSRVGGGQLAAACSGARVCSLVLSDVIGDRLDVIGSGPTVPDSSTFADCLRILDAFGLRFNAGRDAPSSSTPHFPPAAIALLEAGARGEHPENPRFTRVGDVAVIVGSNALSAAAVQATAQRLGYRVTRLCSGLEGEARDVAKVVVALLEVSAGIPGASAADAALCVYGDAFVHCACACPLCSRPLPVAPHIPTLPQQRPTLACASFLAAKRP
jgi:glycerate 2-kinase